MSLHFKRLFHFRENVKTVLDWWIYWKFMLFSWRERQLKLEKVKATQQHIEEFKRQQAEWRRMEHERMEAENRRIMEFVSHQEQTKETRVAKIREREEAKEHLQKIVETPFFNAHTFICLLNDTPVFGMRNHSFLFSSAIWEDWRREAAAWRDGASPWGTLFRRARRG